MSDLSSARVEAFLEMLSAERGAAENTLVSYQRDLDDLSDFLSGRKVSLGAATREDLSSYLSDLAATRLSADLPGQAALRHAAVLQVSLCRGPSR